MMPGNAALPPPTGFKPKPRTDQSNWWDWATGNVPVGTPNTFELPWSANAQWPGWAQGMWEGQKQWNAGGSRPQEFGPAGAGPVGPAAANGPQPAPFGPPLPPKPAAAPLPENLQIPQGFPDVPGTAGRAGPATINMPGPLVGGNAYAQGGAQSPFGGAEHGWGGGGMVPWSFGPNIDWKGGISINPAEIMAQQRQNWELANSVNPLMAQGVASFATGPMANAWTNFGSNMQGAMGQISSILQGNANRMGGIRQQAMDYELAQQQLALQKAAQEGYLANQGRMIDAYTKLFGNFGNMFGGAMGGGGPGGGFPGHNNFAFMEGGNQFGGATLPQGPQGTGMVQTGIDTTPGQVWNPAYADAMRSGLSAQTTAAPLGNVTPGMMQNYADILRSGANRTYNALERGGYEGEGQHLLDQQRTDSQAANLMWNALAKLHKSRQSNKLADLFQNTRLLQQLSV